MNVPQALRRRSGQELVAGIAGLVIVYTVEQLLPQGWTRAAWAALGWCGFGLGALFGCVRVLLRSPRQGRAPWILIGAGVVSWLFGQLVRAMILMADLKVASPSIADAAALAAAALFAFGFVAFLRGQRLALFALVLDAGAVFLVVLAGLAFAVQDVFIGDMRQDPLTTTVVVLYTVLYAAATGAAVSALFGVPLTAPRRPQAVLVIGVGLTALAYALSLPQYLNDTFAAGGIVDLLWMAGMFCISLAPTAWLEDRGQTRAVRTSAAVVARMALPAVVALASAALLVLGQNRQTEDIIAASVALITVLLAVRAGLALYANWRMAEMDGRRARQFEALYEVGLAAAGERSLDELLKLVVEHATSLTRCSGAMAALSEGENRFVIRALHKGPLTQLRESVGEELRGISLEALETRDLVVADRYAEHPHSLPALHDVVASALAIPLVAHGEVIGTLSVYSATPRRFSNDTRRLMRLYAAQAAIAVANARLLEETHRLARDDDLTGVTNRRSLMERFEDELHAATRHGDVLAVVLCDVDGLKTVNDSAGHLAGNEVLIKIARIMRESVRAQDIVARFGGDEFVMLLPRTGRLPAQALVGRMSARLREETYHWAGAEQPVPRVSFGMAWFPEDARTPDALLGVADERMYIDKSRGRDEPESAAEGD